MSKKYNWAVLGCGNIAKKFATELKDIPNATLYAASARTTEKATEFANELGFEKAYGSYEEMVNDPKVDVVYIATPHSYHFEHTLLCLNHKKAVLCEKAFALNSKEVAQMIAASKENNTFLMEAFWVRFKPKFNKVKELIASEDLGKLKLLKSDFFFKANFNPNSRLFDLELGGGSLLDIGIYPVFTSLMLLGKPTQIKAIPQLCSTGTEVKITILLTYENGAIAILNSGLDADYKNDSEITFEKGHLKYQRFDNTPIELYVNNTSQLIDFDKGHYLGYHFEAEHVMKCLDEKLIESPILPLSVSVDLMEILDGIRKEANIVFPNRD